MEQVPGRLVGIHPGAGIDPYGFRIPFAQFVEFAQYRFGLPPVSSAGQGERAQLFWPDG